MNQKIFKMYDIRGIFGQEFDLSDIEKIARALIAFFLEKDSKLKQIAVGRDNRESSPKIFNVLTDQFLALGFDVLNLGLCPTPVVSSMIKNGQAGVGVMITASHNPAEHNGLKIYADFGQVWGKEIAKIGSMCLNSDLNSKQISVIGKLKTSNFQDKIYLSKIFNEFGSSDIENKRFAIDPLGGSSIKTIKKIIGGLNLKNAALIFDKKRKIAQPDPTKETNLEALKKIVLEKKLDFGVALDGDADRMIAVDDLGRTVDGDMLISIFSQGLLKQYKNGAIAVDVKTSDVVKTVIKSAGGRCFYSATGNPLVQNEAAINKAVFCGEASCHFTFFDSGPLVDDGVYAWLRLSKLLSDSSQKLSEIVDGLPKTIKSPEILLKYQNDETAQKCLDGIKNEMLCHGATFTNLDGLKARTNDGWGLIRKSNTQRVLSLKFEAKDEKSLSKIKGYFASTLSNFIDEQEMEQLFE